MKIEPKAGPVLASELNKDAGQSERERSAKARAVAMLTGGNVPTSQNNVSPEEVKSVTAPVAQEHSIEATPSVESDSKPAYEPKEEPLSPQLAMLARREKALRIEAQKVKAEREAFKAKEAEIERNYSQKLAESEKSWKSRLLEDPLSILNENGVSYDTLTERLLNAPKPEDMARDAYTKKLEARLADLESRQEKQAKSYEEAQTAQYQQALNQIRSDVTSLVSSDPEFETIKETKSVDDVVDLIEKRFKQDGTLLTVQEAAKAVEDYLVEEYLKIARISKLQKKLQPKAPVAQNTSETLPQSSKQSQPGKTLTNNMAAPRALTSRERAIAAFKGQLKS